jgi:hypothetical protein
MFAPTARTTPTRLPWWWSLVAMWLLMALWSPAFANEAALQLQAPVAASSPAFDGDDDDAMRVGPWQLLNLSQIWRAARERSGSGAPRLVPLAVMPTETGAWWMGLSRSRTTGDTRFELRFTMPLDGRRLVLPHERDD